jgi:UDP-N-acetylmuramoyl-L-alanyl-D-glutamate--2,6-diaminopimelate ligase
VVVDYAHTPDSLEAALLAAKEIRGGRTVVVFGAGGDRDRDKRSLMGSVAAAQAERAIVTTDNPRGEDPARIAAEIVAGAPGRLETILDRREAIATAIGAAQPGDVVLIAGKGADTEMELANERIPFDDRAVAREIIRRVAVA